MAEVAATVAFGASVLTFIGTAAKVVEICKFYLKHAQNAPSDLRAIYMEVSTMKTILKSVKYLAECDGGLMAVPGSLAGNHGTIAGCGRTLAQLEKILDEKQSTEPRNGQSTRKKVERTLTALAWPSKQSKARRLLDEIRHYKETIMLTLNTEVLYEIKHTRAKAAEIYKAITDSQRREMLRSLRHTDPSSIHRKARKDYELGMGEWMLRLPEWSDWLSGKQRNILLHGIPGAGKTVLMSFLVEQTNQHCETEMFKDRGELSYREELLVAIGYAAEEFQSVFIFVDAIDESGCWEDLVTALKDLAIDHHKNIQLFASSREYSEIMNPIRKFSASISMSNPAVEMDIRLYVRSILQKNARFRKWTEDLLSEIENALSIGAQGMFRWAVCQIDLLHRLKSDRHIIVDALASLPRTLYDTYDRILSLISKEERFFVHHVFQWIQCHNDLFEGKGIPCSILLQAVEVSMAKRTGFNCPRFYDTDILKMLCGCLINVVPHDEAYWHDYDDTREVVAFAHFTVREYLGSSYLLNGPQVYQYPFKDQIQDTLRKIILLEVYSMKSYDFWESEQLATNDRRERVLHALNTDFNCYCMMSAGMLYTKMDCEILGNEYLAYLALNLVDQSKPYVFYCTLPMSIIWDETKLKGGAWPLFLTPKKLFNDRRTR